MKNRYMFMIVICSISVLSIVSIIIALRYDNDRGYPLIMNSISEEIAKKVTHVDHIIDEKYYLSEKLIDEVEAWFKNSTEEVSLKELVKIVSDYLVNDKDSAVAGYWINIESSVFFQKQNNEIIAENKPLNRHFTSYSFRNYDSIVINYDYKDNSDQSFYYESFKNGSVFITDPFVWDNVRMISLAIPVHYYDRIIGVGGVDLATVGLSSLLQEVKYQNMGRARLISERYRVIADSDDSENSGKAILGDSFFQDVFRKLREGKIVKSILSHDKQQINEYRIYYPVFIAESGICWMLEFTIKNNFKK